jgi:hypothetical protein
MSFAFIVHVVSQEECSPCNCFPRGGFDVMLCQGRAIYDFPLLSTYVKNGLKHIEIISTEITCLPLHDINDFNQLITLKELDNRRFSCDCLYIWISSMENTTFKTECSYSTVDGDSSHDGSTLAATRYFNVTTRPTDKNITDWYSNSSIFTAESSTTLSTTDESNLPHWSRKLIYILPICSIFIATCISASALVHRGIKTRVRRVSQIYTGGSITNESFELEPIDNLYSTV